MRPKNLAEIYCEYAGIERKDYLRTVFWRALFPHARPFVPVVRFFHPEHLVADFDFVNDVGSLLHFRDFDLAVDAYVHHPANRGWMRHMARVRVSARRLRRIMLAALPSEAGRRLREVDPAGDTLAPFKAAENRPRPSTGN